MCGLCLSSEFCTHCFFLICSHCSSSTCILGVGSIGCTMAASERVHTGYEAFMKLSNAGYCIDNRDRERLHAWAQAFITFQRIQAHQFVMQNKHDAILMQYSSDETPLKVTRRHSRQHGTIKLQRQSFEPGAYLFQRIFFVNGQGEMKAVLERALKCHVPQCHEAMQSVPTRIGACRHSSLASCV